MASDLYHTTTSDSPDLLAEWRWLVGNAPRCCGWSSAGDLFYTGRTGDVSRLDTGAGEPEVIAASSAAFIALLADAAAAEDILLLPVVRAYEGTHGPLGASDALGFITLPVFGGSYTAENRAVVPIVEHAAFTGDLHRQIRHLPDGSEVRVTVVP